jgi:signal transduction histidine kinase
LRVLQRVLPWAMAAVLLAGVGGGARLAVSLGQPFPGFALMWRKELKLLVVSNVTPPYWPGIVAGMRVNDRILCIDGYMPSPESAVYGLDSSGGEVNCPNGGLNYSTIFQERYSGPTPYVSMQVQREGKTLVISQVPISLFSPGMLLETFLPSFLLGLGFLVLGAVVLRAGPTAETNVMFALSATIVAAFSLNQGYSFIITPQMGDATLAAVLMVVMWMPLLGAVVFHMIDILTPSRPLSVLNRRLRKPYYLLSALVATVGVLTYIFKDHPLSYSVSDWYLAFIAISLSFAIIWGLVGVTWAVWRAPSRRVRRQAGLLLSSLAITLAFMVPYLLYFFTATSASGRISSVPYLGLALVAVLAYAILRYQVFASRARILTTLVIAIICILVANLVYLFIGQRVGIVPIMVATLLTGLALEARQGPMSFFNRLLRREVLDYQTVAQFSEQLGQLQKADSLLAGIRRPLYDSLDVDHVAVWLFDPANPAELQRYVDGQPAPAMAAPTDLAAHLRSHPDPLHSDTQQASPLQALAADADPIALWAPLVERDVVAGVLGLGPRWTGEVYGERDLQLIGILARQMTLSILNARQLERLQAMSQFIAQAEENERRKIARELHDTILQFLLVLTYGLDDLKERQAALTAEIERWQNRISAEAGQLRSLLTYLRAPEVLVQQGLIASLEAWIEQTRQETAIRIQTDLASEAAELLSLDAQVAAYRVFREAIHNAVKHANASEITARMAREADQVHFSIRDDGQGFDVAQVFQGSAKGYSSLADMRAYVESVGGELRFHSSKDNGTEVVGLIPILIPKEIEKCPRKRKSPSPH